MALDMAMNAARGVGVTSLIMHLVGGAILLAILGLPFGYQMHASGNRKGLTAGVMLWVLVGLFNFGTMASYWPLRLVIMANEARLLEIHGSLASDETRELNEKIGPIRVLRAMNLRDGNTYFITSGPLGDTEGLVYSPSGNPVGINEWSNIRVAAQWAVVEED